MNRTKSLLLCGLTSGLAFSLSAQLLNQPPSPATQPATPLPTPATAATATPASTSNALAFDAEARDYHAKHGETSAPFIFTVTNISTSEVMINRLSTSCGCTVAQLPSQPYKLAPGATVPISVSLDMRNKQGVVTKTVSVDSSVGFKSLLVRAHIPPATNVAIAGNAAGNTMGDRAKNIQMALADRQAVFKGECVSCHVDKGRGKMGAALYKESCGICHDAEHRAAMVTDLKVPRTARDLSFWQKWIMEGKAGTMMPAFASVHGGSLTQEQIDSLTIYCYQNFPKEPLPEKQNGLAGQPVAAKPTPTTARPRPTLPPVPLPLPPGTQKN